MAKVNRKTKRRIFITFIFWFAISITFGYNVYHYSRQILNKYQEQKFLKEKLVILKEDEDLLKQEVQKMSDPNYIARYAREKYLYSKDGEIIIKIP